MIYRHQEQHNKSLELTPEVAPRSGAGIQVVGDGCAVVGGAAQLYVRAPRLFVAPSDVWPPEGLTIMTERDSILI